MNLSGADTDLSISNSRRSIACCDEIVPAFVWREEIADFTDCVEELVEGSGSDASQMRLELGECHFYWIEVRGIWREEQKPTAVFA